jgi:hypothetical protein
VTAFVAALLMAVLVPGPGATLHEYGITLRLASPWHGVLFGPHELGPPAAVELQLATFPFTRRRGLHYMWDLGRPPQRNDLHVILADYGRVHLVRKPPWSRPPLRIRARDVDGPFEGSEPSHGVATRVFLVGGHQLQVWVEFDVRRPASRLVARANELLARIRIAEAR